MISTSTCANTIINGIKNNRLHTTCFTPIYVLAWSVLELPYATTRKCLYALEKLLRKQFLKKNACEYAFLEEKH